ncbi:MAG: S53 family peptidase [Acidimicrobiales bacterium]
MDHVPTSGQLGFEWRRRVRRTLAALSAILLVCSSAVLVTTAAGGVPARPAAAQPAAAKAGSSTSATVGSASVAPPGVTELGPSPRDARLHLDVVLQPRDSSALDRLVNEVSDPSSPRYRHYLAKGQFGRDFGATTSTIADVSDRLRAAGLHVGPVSADGLTLPVSATVGQAESAFGVVMHAFAVGGGAVVNANTTTPSLPRDIAPSVQAVVGLDNLPASATPGPASAPEETLSPAAGPKTIENGSDLAPGQPAACSSAVATGHLTAPDVAQAYDFDPLYAGGDFGAGESVDLFEQSGFPASDIQTYQDCYGTHVNIDQVPVDGGPTTTTGPFARETELDIEDIIGLDPHLSRLYVYESPADVSYDYDIDQAIASDDNANVVSISSNACESDVGSSQIDSESVEFGQMAAQGQTVFAASGDFGAQACLDLSSPESGLAVNDPASQPWVTGVGGTDLNDLGEPPLTAPTETAWGSSGGGVSSDWFMPSWQTGPGVVSSSSSGSPCGNSGGLCREVPDVSADAGTCYATFVLGSWGCSAGTSASTPTWAALMVLIDASSRSCSTDPVGFVNRRLYALAKSNPEDFNDITSGNNGYYAATSGYDMATGLGSPEGANLAQSLCPRTFIAASVSGSQTYGSSAPTLKYKASRPKGVKVSGSVTCPKPFSLNGKSFTDSPTLQVGTYRLDAQACTGLVDSKPTSYVLNYSGVLNGFVVSKDKTTTTVSVNHSSVPYGNESAETFTIKVRTAGGEEIPASAIVPLKIAPGGSCSVTVVPAPGGGTGTCGSADTTFPAASYTVSAKFPGDSDLKDSSSPKVALVVSKDPTSTALTVSPSVEYYGHDSSAVFTVEVATTHGEKLPKTEHVTVDIGGTSCKVTLAPAAGGGDGTCSLANDTALLPGFSPPFILYTATANYSGDTDLSGSEGGTVLSITKAPVPVEVSGSETYGGTPTFSETKTPPKGVTVSGTPTCTTVGTSTAISPSLGAGKYTVEGASCTGLSLSGPNAAYYQPSYTGVTNGFVVAKDTTTTALTVTPTSEPLGSESGAVFTVTVNTAHGEKLPETDGVTVTIPTGLGSQFGPVSCLAVVAPAPGGGSGSCTLANGSALPLGNYSPSASYLGDSDLLGSGPVTATFTVTP